jgi:hypothetical protein
MQTLYANFVAAELAYLRYMKIHKYPEFLEETKGYVWDHSNPICRFYRPEVPDQPSSCSKPKSGKLYKALALFCHPDKCGENSATIFKILNEANSEGNCLLMERMKAHLDVHGSLETFDHQTEIKKQEIEFLKDELWYAWYDEKSGVKSVFVDPLKVLESENNTLRRQVSELEFAITKCKI